MEEGEIEGELGELPDEAPAPAVKAGDWKRSSDYEYGPDARSNYDTDYRYNSFRGGGRGRGRDWVPSRYVPENSQRYIDERHPDW